MIWASTVSAPTRVARKVSVPVVLSVPPITRSPARFSTGRLSPVIMLSSTPERPSVTTPSTATVSPGRTRTRSPTRTSAIATSSSEAVTEHARRPWREPDQAPDGIRGVAAGARLEEAAEQDQRDDRRGRVEVERQRLAVHAGPAARKNAGNSDRREAVAVGGRGPDDDQRVHVGRPMPERLSAHRRRRASRPRTGPASRSSELEPRVGQERRQPRGDGHPREAQEERHREDRRDKQPAAQGGDVPGSGLVALGPASAASATSTSWSGAAACSTRAT